MTADEAFGPNGLIMLVPMARVVELTNKRGRVVQPGRPAPVARPSPLIISDPNRGTPRCRRCGGFFYSDQRMIRVSRWRWLRGFVHEEGACRRG